MNKPFIFCHMLTSLDGKIIGNYMNTEQGEIAGNHFYDIAFGENRYYQHQGWISGRITTDDNFTFYKKPELDNNAPIVPIGDFKAEHTDNMYYISIDPHGKLGWDNNTLMYNDTKAHVIEVLTEQTSNSYKDFLRKRNISYIISGDKQIDFHIMIDKLYNIFGLKNIMLGGGGVLNWSFIQQGLCDEISIVMAAAADGSSEAPSLFETSGFSKDTAFEFSLEHVEKLSNDTVWLRYKTKYE